MLVYSLVFQPLVDSVELRSTEREEKNRPEKSKGVHEIMGAKAFAAEKPPKKEDKPKAHKPPKGNNEIAAPVLVKPNPKKDGKEKDTGKGDKSRGRSPSQDRKSIPCIYHFQKGGYISLSEWWMFKG